MNSLIRKWLVVGAAGTGAFGLVYGAAASLSLSGANLSAAAGAVSACASNPVGLAYTTAYDNGDGRYEVTAVVVTLDAADNDACDGKTLSVTLSDGGTSVGDGSAAVDEADVDNQYTLAIAAAPGADLIDGVAVSIG